MIEKYKTYLKGIDLCPLTQKNYLCDVRYYLRWVKNETRDTRHETREKENETQGWFNLPILQAFKKALIAAHTSPTTINRRLAGLRKFGEFLISQGWLRENPAQRVCNTQHATRNTKDYESILTQFKQALKIQGQSKTTIKNYTNDVRQYLRWVGRYPPRRSRSSASWRTTSEV